MASEVMKSMTVGDRIKYYRGIRGMTQYELAQKLGVQIATISKYELGIVTNIPLRRLEQLASALDITVGILTGSEEDTIDPCQSEVHNKLISRLSEMDDAEKAILLQMADQIIKYKKGSSR